MTDIGGLTMADIVIRGMKLPKSGGIFCINIFPDGKVTRQLDLSCEQIATAVPLPEGHGRLIDADALIRDKSGEATLWCGYEYQDHPIVFEEDILTAPTIVPAEGGNDDA